MNIRSEIIKFLRKKAVKFSTLILVIIFPNLTPKAKSTKAKINK